MQGLLRWYYTVCPLKAEQWWYRLTRPVAMRLVKRHKATTDDIAIALRHPQIALGPLEVASRYNPSQNEFCFLNRSKIFDQQIDWDYAGEGLLWTYNLNYFEWLYDDSLSKEDRLATIQSFVTYSGEQKVARHAYPISLRTVSWIRFLLRFDIQDEAILNRLISDAQWLYRFPEYHLLGNHLFENAMALFCAGLYFGNERFYNKGTQLLRRCITDQILPDGGHIEGSPMYHSLLLWRLLQCIELHQALRSDKNDLGFFLRDTASKMSGWISAMTFSDGSWPMFNDATAGIAPSTQELLRYAKLLRLSVQEVRLKESGYRMIKYNSFELAIDVGKVQPAHQPGHAHADISTFCLHFEGKAVLIDTGTSTYEISSRRAFERSTSAHNTVIVGNTSSSDTWRSFRIGRRARLIDVGENTDSISVTYVPYTFQGITHRRTFSWNDNCIQVEDFLQGYKAGSHAYLHFAPEVTVALRDGVIHTDQLNIYMDKKVTVQLSDFQAASGFNCVKDAQSACFHIKDYLIIKIAKR